MLAAALWLIPASRLVTVRQKGITPSLAQTDIASTEPLIYSIRVAPDSTALDASARKVVVRVRGMDSKLEPHLLDSGTSEGTSEGDKRQILGQSVSVFFDLSSGLKTSAAYHLLDTPSLKDCSLGART